MFDVFLSHNRRQKPWVRELAQILKAAGLKVFFDEESISPGADVVRALESALENSKHVVFIMTPASLESDWVALETACTVYSDPAARKGILVPVMLERVNPKQIPPFIRRLNYVDLSDPETRQAHLQRLLNHLGLAGTDAPSMSHWPMPPGPSSSPLTVADFNDVLSWGWDGKRLLDELIRIDYATLDQLKDLHEGNTDQWAPVFIDHPDTWRLLTTSPEKIVGYWHFVPLFDPEYEKAKLGQLLDSEITADKVRFFEMPGNYNIYFVSMNALFQYRGIGTLRLLIASICAQMVELARQDILIKDVCANAYTETGVSLCRSFGLEPQCDHVERGKIYVGTLDNLAAKHLCDFHPNLKRYYST